MVVAEMSRGSVRLERAEFSRLGWAFALSLALHLLVFGSYEAGKKFGWWQTIHWPAWLPAPRLLAELLKKREPLQPVPPREPPLMFVDVSPAQAVAEPPKEAKFYSDKNSRAANPDANKDTDTPRITGTQKEVVKTEDVPREKNVPLQPAPPPPLVPAAKVAQEEAKPKPAYTPGDLTMAKPEPALRTDTGQETHPRPRTIQEALAQRQAAHRLPSEKMNQEGGVRRHLEISSLDARATPFGIYDAALVAAISQRWFALLDARDYASDSQGKVVLQFTLHFDGRITDMQPGENTAGEVLGLICEKAVLDPSPFAPWPSDMRHLMGGDERKITFTFYYH